MVTGHCHQKEYLRKRVLNTLSPSAKALVRIPACSVAGTTEITWFSETVKMTPEICTKKSVKRGSSQKHVDCPRPHLLGIKAAHLAPFKHAPEPQASQRSVCRLASSGGLGYRIMLRQEARRYNIMLRPK